MPTKTQIAMFGVMATVLAGALRLAAMEWSEARGHSRDYSAHDSRVVSLSGRAGEKQDVIALDPPALDPLDLSDMRLWNWQAKWHASHWDHAFSDVPWRFGNVRKARNGDVFFDLDRNGAPELQGVNQVAQRKGLWEADVTLPKLASGLVVAPLWVYNQSTKDEIDFEFAGQKGLQLTIHSFGSGSHRQAHVMVPNTGDWSGRRVRFGIHADIDGGWIKMLINGKTVHTFTRASSPEAFPVSDLKPFVSMWPAKSGLAWAESWVGRWDGQPASMVVHGYRFSP